MKHDMLLPGVERQTVPPEVVCRSRKIIARARLRAAIRDALQIITLVCVDVLFIRWPNTHIPGLERGASGILLTLANGSIVALMILARVMPAMSARRIASTWCEAERARVASGGRRRL